MNVNVFNSVLVTLKYLNFLSISFELSALALQEHTVYFVAGK